MVILLAVALDDEILRRHESFVGKAQRVGTHVSYKAYRALPCNINAFVKLLGNRHGASRGHAQAAGSLLLERGGYKRGRWTAMLFASLDCFYHKRLVLRFSDDSVDLVLRVQLKLLIVLAVVARGEISVGLVAV